MFLCHIYLCFSSAFRTSIHFDTFQYGLRWRPNLILYDHLLLQLHLLMSVLPHCTPWPPVKTSQPDRVLVSMPFDATLWTQLYTSSMWPLLCLWTWSIFFRWVPVASCRMVVQQLVVILVPLAGGDYILYFAILNQKLCFILALSAKASSLSPISMMLTKVFHRCLYHVKEVSFYL